MHSLPQLSAFKPPVKKTILSYPGKVTVNGTTGTVAISDTANHRIIVASSGGKILVTIIYIIIEFIIVTFLYHDSSRFILPSLKKAPFFSSW